MSEASDKDITLSDAQDSTGSRDKDIWMPEEIPEEQVPNPRTATLTWWYAQVVDPYGVVPDLPEEAQLVGREYFLVEDGKTPVLVRDVRAMHPEIDEREWEALMQAAAARDESYDPFPFFHLYR